MTQPAAVRLTGVSKAFGRASALDNVSLTLATGSLIALAGPNGAGKTTLARTIAGFLRADRGDVALFGLAPREYRRRFGLGYMPEDGPRGWPNASVEELLLWKGVPDEIAAEYSFVRHLLPKRLGVLSKGQWRLALLAFALANQPQLVILDEPESGLDPAAYDWLTDALRGAVRRGACVITLTHHIPIIQVEADRVVFVADGKIMVDSDARGLSREQLTELYAQTYRDAR